LGQKSENIFESRMGLIVIPADYEKRSDRVVPICIRAEDDLGNRIAEGWIHGVVRVADRIRALARNFLADEWRSSELADETVQELWSIHKGDVGLKPHSRVYAHAKWKALDKRKRPSNAPVNPRRLVLDLLHERKAGGNPATAQPGGSGSAG
jgi:hypothetical protein